MSKYLIIPGTDFVPNTSAQWFIGRQTSGMPMLQRNPNNAADTNVIIQVPLWTLIDENGVNPYIQDITFHYFVSSISANGKAFLSASFRAYDVIHESGLVFGFDQTSAAGIKQPGALASAGFTGYQASGQNWAGSFTNGGVGLVVSALPVSAVTDTFTNITLPFGGDTIQRSIAYPYVPWRKNSCMVGELSASLGASAEVRFYGAIVRYSYVGSNIN